ncbi:endonuclease/exonuclease/phosphatase family protein [Antarctobacter sp.]|uniref:endonuclease/exonuclease/phosphatase family protein n=1 Tax=Antarctobacter sp. TaxID=1872577 RepID=UPI002B271265|nr:endonuclease/exonuclease/phosphatase family protein [Antarctobacter sp.]
MRPVLTQTVSEMETPSAAARAEAIANGGDAAFNARAQAQWPCLNTLELRQPPAPLPAPQRLTVAAWNIERCKRVEDSAELLRSLGADVVLATEVDIGMARSGQRHTVRDLAEALGMGYAFGTEFVELGTGDPYETSLFADIPNTHGLHGNAILSRYPLENVALIPLDAGGMWFVSQPKNDGQLRLGGRMAVAAQVATPHGPLTLTAAHYESESDAAGRAADTRTLIDRLDSTYGTGPTVIGGDLNTKSLMDGIRTYANILADPAPHEPCFDVFESHSFDWRGCNAGLPTTRAAPGKPVNYPLWMLDWLFTRGVAATDARVTPALSAAGQYLSDHELLTCRIDMTGAPRVRAQAASHLA